MDEGIVKTVTTGFTNVNDLYTAFMPYVKSGGLFIRTDGQYFLGEQINLHVILLDDPKVHVVDCQVVWLTPSRAQRGLKAGIGLQFMGDNGAELLDQIQTLLAGLLQSDRITDTM